MTSPLDAADGSPPSMGDAEETGAIAVPGSCAWCRAPLTDRDPLTKYCSKRCRQTAWRLRRRRETANYLERPMRFKYFDPPYLGLAKKYYQHEESYRGEVDHEALVAGAVAEGLDGWALSASARSLRVLLPLMPAETRLCPWVKPIGVAPATHGIHNTWEALLVVGGRQRPPGRRDWLRAMPARLHGELPGRKPLAFWAWLFDLLGMVPGDSFVDVFPGTGMGGLAWANLSRAAHGDGSPRYRDDTTSPAPSDAQFVAPPLKTVRTASRPWEELQYHPGPSAVGTDDEGPHEYSGDEVVDELIEADKEARFIPGWSVFE